LTLSTGTAVLGGEKTTHKGGFRKVELVSGVWKRRGQSAINQDEEDLTSTKKAVVETESEKHGSAKEERKKKKLSPPRKRSGYFYNPPEASTSFLYGPTRAATSHQTRKGGGLIVY